MFSLSIATSLRDLGATIKQYSFFVLGLWGFISAGFSVGVLVYFLEARNKKYISVTKYFGEPKKNERNISNTMNQKE